MAMQSVLGLMSGTSLDGIDVAMLATDGEAIGGFGPTLFRPYSDVERKLLRAALRDARVLKDRTARPGVLRDAEEMTTAAHAAAIEEWQRQNLDEKPTLVGFHGQTVFHAPGDGVTVQLGDGDALAKRIGIPVVYDFRAADVAAGGEGAPLVPVYHAALAAHFKLRGSVIVVNIGGVANITRIANDGSILAGDTGPGNALIDDFVLGRSGLACDRDGALAAAGRVDEAALAALMLDAWFDQPFPKSLDRDAFSAAPLSELSLEDGAATLSAFTARTIARGISAAGGAETIVVVGGGAHNPTLLRHLGETAGSRILTGVELGWDGDFIEAQAFAFLAARSRRSLPITFPETTGVSRPLSGGRLALP